MLAWHCEPELKASAMARLREHRHLEQIAQGFYWEDGRGCNLGCLTHAQTRTHEAASRCDPQLHCATSRERRLTPRTSICLGRPSTGPMETPLPRTTT